MKLEWAKIITLYNRNLRRPVLVFVLVCGNENDLLGRAKVKDIRCAVRNKMQYI
jgi:hypothetical protein